jgi:arylsulfatase A-like enzyme
MRHGFDDYFGLPYSNDMWPYHPETKPGRWPDLPLIDGEEVVNSAVQPADQKLLTRRYTNRAVDFIRENAQKPFFLYLAHSMPHVPLFVSDRFEGRSGTGLYGDVVMEIDWSVGEIMTTLEREKIADDTLVIFTSDNGPWLSYGEHAGSAFPLREGKGTSWEGGVRVPCVMRWPGRIPAGTVCDQPLMTIDLFPTVANLIAAKLPDHKIDGMDVWPIISGQKDASNPHRAYFFYYHGNDLEGMISGDGRWKMIMPHKFRTLNGRAGGFGGKPVKYETGDAGLALYDLRADVAESKNVANQYPEVVADMTIIANQMRKELGDNLMKISATAARQPGRVE